MWILAQGPFVTDMRWILHLVDRGAAGKSAPVVRDGTSEGERTAWIVSYTPVAREPRVIRQADALMANGWRVVVIGEDGAGVIPPGWHFVPLPLPGRRRWLRAAVAEVARRLGSAGARSLPRASWRQRAAVLANMLVAKHRRNAACLVALLDTRPELRPALVLSHDYYTADVGGMLAALCGARFSVDCHEYAREQYMDDASWVRNVRPRVVALQDYALPRADLVTTVCDGIADLITRDQHLARPAEVIRSVPHYREMPDRPVGDRIYVLYHGIVAPIRGLHVAVTSMRLWRPEFHFVIRGDVTAGYRKELERLASQGGVLDRLHFEEAVPFGDIVPAANRADVGFFAHDDVSPQKRFALPNKFFEYVMAGLALCVSDLPEMAQLVRRHGLGQLVSGFDERAIADAVNGFDRQRIERCKRASLIAARELNWDVESRYLISLYEGLFK